VGVVHTLLFVVQQITFNGICIILNIPIAIPIPIAPSGEMELSGDGSKVLCCSSPLVHRLNILCEAPIVQHKCRTVNVPKRTSRKVVAKQSGAQTLAANTSQRAATVRKILAVSYCVMIRSRWKHKSSSHGHGRTPASTC